MQFPWLRGGFPKKGAASISGYLCSEGFTWDREREGEWETGKQTDGNFKESSFVRRKVGKNRQNCYLELKPDKY